MVERARRRRGEVPRDCRPERALGSRLSRFGRVHELSTHDRPQRVTDDLASQRGLGALDFLDSIKKAGAVRTLESLARIELGAQGGALLERVTTTRTSKSGVATTTVRERFTAPDWHADGWFGLVSADGARPARPRSGEGG